MTTIGILVCGAFSDEIMKKHNGVYEDFFIDGLLGADPSLNFVTYAVHNEIFPKSIDQCDAWLITGSKSGVYENLPWMLRLQDFIRDAYSHDIPLVGICFGHQILAQALGGNVEKAKAGWGLGFQSYEVLEPLEGIGNRLDLYAIHQDQVIDVPKDARVIVRTDHCPNAGLIYKGRAISFQPHPEFSKEFITDLINSILGDSIIPEDGLKAIDGMKNTSVDNHQIMGVMASVLKGER